MYTIIIKPVLDFIFSVFLLIILSPIFIITMFSLLIINKGNPFFIQVRPGKYNKVFKLYKFKTMTDEKNNNGELLTDDERMTKFGLLVRKLSLDELPQLVNVLKFDMSLVGPRPLLVEYLEFYNEDQIKRHNVKPGITGWAQVNGRNLLTWEEKFELDLWYVNNITFLLDLKIIAITIMKIIKREGVNTHKNFIMEYFRGTNK